MPISLTKESDVDVLVIGAGPAGLMCAHALKKFGINVRIVDKRPSKVAAGQADGIQPRTIEVLQSYGLAERLLREGNQMHMAAFYNPGPNGGIERTGRAPDVTAPTARYPFEVTLHQGAIESIFLDSMASMGLTVERPVIPTSLECSTDPKELADPHSHPVRVVLKNLDPSDGQNDAEIVHAKYVLGSDGAHSWVRKSLGISMDGEQTDYVWGVLDLVPDTDFPDIRNRTAIHSANGSCMIIPREGDKVRLYLQLTGDQLPIGEDGRIDKKKMGPEKLLEVAKRSFYPYRMQASGEIDWWTLYIIGQRVASNFSVSERVFIAGDACHTHSPKAGQGMNASMNDTHNLAWKIAQVLRGWAQPSLLKTYEFERRKYARDLIDFDREFSALFSGKPRTAENENGISHEQFLKAFQTFGGFTSGIGIQYSISSLTRSSHQDLVSKVQLGQRMPPHVFVRAADARPIEIQDVLPSDTRYKLLVFAGDIAQRAQIAKINALAADLAREDRWFRRYTPANGDAHAVFDVLSISAGRKESVSYTDFPELLRPHWSKVYVDDTDMQSRVGGGGYDAYGVSPEGAIVVIRPDGYVGAIAPLEDGVQNLESYFSGILRSQT